MRRSEFLTMLGAGAVAGLGWPSRLQAQGKPENFVLKNVTIHPVTSAEIANGSLVVTNGKIADLGAKVATPSGHKVIDAKGLHVYPGLIDSATNVGMEEVSAVRETGDVTELGDFNSQLRSVVAINPSSEHIPVTRASGITTNLITPAGGIIGGQAAMMHLDGWTWEEMAIERFAAMQCRFPVIGGGRGSAMAAMMGMGSRASFAEQKKRYEQQLQDFRQFLERARAYAKAKAVGGANFRPDLRLEPMIPVVEGKKPLMVVAVRERTIREAITFAEKENLKIILAGVREPGEQLKRIAEKKIPVILSETLELPLEEDSSYDEPFTLAGKLHAAGIKFAFATFSVQFARNLPFQAASSVGFGLPAEEALKAITIYPAEIFGVADRIGSLEKGKWADLILTDGDPLEARSTIKRMWIMGKAVSLETRHTKLYDQYKNRP